MPVKKKHLIINRQASDATNRAEIFLLPFRIANTIGKEVKQADIAPLTEENLYRMENKSEEHNK